MVINQFPARFGRYILLDRLAAGGMAEVFRAKVTGVEGFERLLAIKCMLPQLLSDEQFVSMFRDEAKLASQLVHANIVQIYEPGRLGERLYIAMELVNGRDLRHILRTAKASGSHLPTAFAAYIVAKAAEGLDFAHRKLTVDGQPLNLVHRDVSPQNILVSYDGEVKVVDFGIAKAEARTTETQAGVLKGKFAYMAPEQVTGSATDRRADIFALGSVLYEAVTGARLFTGDTDLSVLEKVRSARLPNFADVLPPGAEEIASILQRSLARKPDDRYSYASEMAEDLERVLVSSDRSVFGAKRAAMVMRSMYTEEIAQLAENQRAYADIGPEQCVVNLGDERDPEGESFTNFTGTPTSRPLGGSSGVTSFLRSNLTPAHTPSRTVTLAKSPSPAPKPGRRRGRERERPEGEVEDEDTDKHTRVETLTDSKGTARVVRNLRIAFVLALLLVGGLVAVATVKLSPKGHPAITLNSLIDVLNTPVVGPLHPPDATPPPGGDDSLKAAVLNNASLDASEGRGAHGDGHGEGRDDSRRATGYVNIRVFSPEKDKVRVFIDQLDRGLAPVTSLQLSVGEHEVRLVEETTARSPRVLVKTIFVGSKNTHKAPLVQVYSMRDAEKTRR